jgi:hypothetical protein
MVPTMSAVARPSTENHNNAILGGELRTEEGKLGKTVIKPKGCAQAAKNCPPYKRTKELVLVVGFIKTLPKRTQAPMRFSQAPSNS